MARRRGGKSVLDSRHGGDENGLAPDRALKRSRNYKRFRPSSVCPSSCARCSSFSIASGSAARRMRRHMAMKGRTRSATFSSETPGLRLPTLGLVRPARICCDGGHRHMPQASYGRMQRTLRRAKTPRPGIGNWRARFSKSRSRFSNGFPDALVGSDSSAEAGVEFHRQLREQRHRHPRRTRAGTSAHRQPDSLHFRRFRPANRGARGGHSARASFTKSARRRGKHRERLPDRARHRAAVRGRDGKFSAHEPAA